MKTIDEIRYDNLEILVAEAQGLSRLVEKANGKLSRPTLDQILKRRKTSAGATKNVGDEMARKIEDALKLEPGWMDNNHGEPGATAEPTFAPEDVVELVSIYLRADDEGRRLMMAAAKTAAEMLPGATADDQLKRGR